MHIDTTTRKSTIRTSLDAAFQILLMAWLMSTGAMPLWGCFVWLTLIFLANYALIRRAVIWAFGPQPTHKTNV